MAMLAPANLLEGIAASILGNLPDLPDNPNDPEAADEDTWVLHMSKTGRYHDPACSRGKNGKRVTLAVAKRQLNAQPAGCCKGKKSRTAPGGSE